MHHIITQITPASARRDSASVNGIALCLGICLGICIVQLPALLLLLQASKACACLGLFSCLLRQGILSAENSPMPCNTPRVLRKALSAGKALSSRQVAPWRVDCLDCKDYHGLMIMIIAIYNSNYDFDGGLLVHSHAPAPIVYLYIL